MTIVVADTTCSLPRDQLAELGIPLIPQVVMFGDESYHDDTDLDTASFLKKLKASADLPKTAAPEPPLYYPIFKAAQEKGESVIVVAPSAKVSGTVRSAETAALEFPDLDVRVIDTQTISCNLATLVLTADNMAKTGKSAEEIETKLHEMIRRGRIFFLVDTLEYLQKGGRIGGAKALVAELLQIKPILQIADGQVEPFEQQRTRRRALSRLIEIIDELCPITPEAHLAVMHVEADLDAWELATVLKTRFGFANIPIYELPPAIVVHGGPKTMGIGFFVDMV